MKQTMRILIIIGGIFWAILAIGYAFQMPWAINTWPWEDGRLSYLFIASIQAAIAAAMLWIGLSGQFGSIAAGGLNLFVMAGGMTLFFGQLVRQTGQSHLTAYAWGCALFALINLSVFIISFRIPVSDRQPIPRLLRFSFILFTLILFAIGGAMIAQRPNIFPWPLQPETSTLFGWIFFGDAFYFLYGVLRPYWAYARAQLWSFLVYDLVLIGPFLAHLPNVSADLLPNLIVYIAVLLYSGGLSIYYLRPRSDR